VHTSNADHDNAKLVTFFSNGIFKSRLYMTLENAIGERCTICLIYYVKKLMYNLLDLLCQMTLENAIGESQIQLFDIVNQADCTLIFFWLRIPAMQITTRQS